MINISDSATKLNSLNRRMFILATAKIIILGGIVSRLFFLQVKENKKYLTLSDKIEFENGNCPLLEESLKTILETLLLEILRLINSILFLRK